MNKSDLVKNIATKVNLSQTAVASVVDALFSSIIAEVSKGKGHDVRLIGFGTFTSFTRKETTGRNPKTGAKMKIPSSTVPKFRPGKEFKDKVNKKKK